MRTELVSQKPFRIAAEGLMYTQLGTPLIHCKIPAKYVMEYNNPKAAELYKKAQETKDIYEKAKLLEEMGDYELKALNIKEYSSNIFDRLLKKFLLK